MAKDAGCLTQIVLLHVQMPHHPESDNGQPLMIHLLAGVMWPTKGWQGHASLHPLLCRTWKSFLTTGLCSERTVLPAGREGIYSDKGYAVHEGVQPIVDR
jgi:hypothetical protein